jgi:glycosyltransferase involved in cell wall biosynthesis
MNEASNLPSIHAALRGNVASTGNTYELVFVCDPSSDDSEEVLREIAKSDSRVKLLFTAERVGQTEAIRAGYGIASGDAVICMDADFQDPPELIPELIKEWENGSLIVHTKRSSRKADNLVHRLATSLGYRCLGWLTNGKVMHNVGDFRLIDRSILPLILSFKDPQPFWRGICSLPGIKHSIVSYKRPSRKAGNTKYGRLIGSPSVAIRGVVSITNRPLNLLQASSAYLSVLSLLVGVGFFITELRLNATPPTIIYFAPVIGVLVAAHFASIAIISAYLAMIGDQTKRKPNYLLRPETLDEI